MLYHAKKIFNIAEEICLIIPLSKTLNPVRSLAIKRFDFAENFSLIRSHLKALERMQSLALKSIACQIYYHSHSNLYVIYEVSHLKVLC